MVGFIKKLLVFIAIGMIFLTIYAYLAPLLGVSFDPVRNTKQIPVILNES